VCKLGDFGCSRRHGEIETASRTGSLPPGTPGYQAPELLFTSSSASAVEGGASFAADVYAFGVTAWQLRHRHGGGPFGGAHPHEIIYQVSFLVAISILPSKVTCTKVSKALFYDH